MSTTTNNTDTPAKPKWVEALEKAEQNLELASASHDPDAAHAYSAIAHAWMDVARIYQQN